MWCFGGYIPNEENTIFTSLRVDISAMLLNCIMVWKLNTITLPD